MSLVKDSKYGYLLSHKTLIDEIYTKVDPAGTSFQIKPELFKVFSPFKLPKIPKSRNKTTNKNPFEAEVHHVKTLYKLFYPEIKEFFTDEKFEVRNEAINTANEIYEQSGKNLITDILGANYDESKTKIIQNSTYLFPENCKFYSKDVKDISEYLNERCDLILLDPPWWNKYIRRKRKHTEHGYDMMYNEDLKSLPLENHLNDDSLVVVWCTNSQKHLSFLIDEIFPKWGVEYLGKWYWVKVTQSGVPVGEFAQPPQKQPFEQIILAYKKNRNFPNPPSDKVVVSVPSVLHSHKPPLMKLLEPFLPNNPKCLELFARYLLPNCTSYGKEVLRFQHESLYLKVSK